MPQGRLAPFVLRKTLRETPLGRRGFGTQREADPEAERVFSSLVVGGRFIPFVLRKTLRDALGRGAKRLAQQKRSAASHRTNICLHESLNLIQ